MLFEGKPLQQLTEADLQTLVRDEWQESDTLEFKRDMYGGTRDDKREMLKDIESMANHKGGWLLIGVEEDDNGTAIALPGVEPGNHVERIRSSCLANVQRRLFGLEVEDVGLSNGNVVVAVRIPQSLNGPHMITHEGLYQFWKRYGRQKDRMSVDEVEVAFENRLNAETRLERFLAVRKQRALSAVPPPASCLFLTATPVFVREEFIDTGDAGLQTLLQGYAQRHYVPPLRTPEPTLHGLRLLQGLESLPQEHFELDRNGHIEFRYLWDKSDNSISSTRVARYIVDFLHLVHAIYDHSKVYGPLEISVSLLNVRGLRLAVSRQLDPFNDYNRQWEEGDHLELPPHYVHQFDQDFDVLVKKLNDRLWNAFGWQDCPLFDESGQPTEFLNLRF